MNEPTAQTGADQKSMVPETPEDVAILFSWANLHGAKYRDFSASRREFRAQQRARVAERQREAELAAARGLEATAQRELQKAQRLLEDTQPAQAAAAADAEAKQRAEDAFRRAEQRAQQEKLEAQRREQAAEELRLLAEKARSEMLEARKRAEDQAARYAEFDAQHPTESAALPARSIPGELADPYYYTGQVDPAYFAPTPGVRTAQAARISTQRKAYQFPMHPGSDEYDAGTIGSYRPDTAFAPSPSSGFRSLSLNPYDIREERRADEWDRSVSIRYSENSPQPQRLNEDRDTHIRGILPGLHDSMTHSDHNTAAGDLHIRPMARRMLVDVGQYSSPSSANMFAPAPRRRATDVRASDVEATAVHGGQRGPEKQESLTNPLHMTTSPAIGSAVPLQNHVPPSNLGTLSEPESSVDVTEPHFTGPPSPVAVDNSGEPPFRSMDRRSRSLRRRRDSLDKGARTTRQPRPELPLPAGTSVGHASAYSPVPPAWFVQPDSDGQEHVPELLPASDAMQKKESTPGDLTTPAADPPVSRLESAHVPASMEADIPFAVRQIIGENARTYHNPRRSVSPNREAEISEFPQNRGGLAERYQELEPGSGDASDSVPAGLPLHHTTNAGLHFAAPVETRSEVSTAFPLAPDTLQQSRERVASRWFALKGLVGPSAGDQPAPAHSYDTKSPALSVLSLSGGVGKTSIVATIGRALSSLGETVLLADTNTHGMLPYYFGARDQRPGMVRTFTPPPGSADAPVLLVNYEADGLAADDDAQLRILNDIQRRSEGIQRVLLDLNSSHLWIARRMAKLNPWVLVPIAPDMNSVLGTHTVERLFADVVDADNRAVKPFYVLNQFDPALPLHLDVREVLRQFLGDRLLPIMIHRSPTVPEALAEGMTVIDYAPESPVTEDFMNLAAWLRKLFAPVSANVHGARWSER